MGKVVGIDLGTTNSCVACVENGQPQVIPDEEGERTVPSYVSFRSGGAIVGHLAKKDVIDAASEVVYAAKRLIGRSPDSPEIVKTEETCSYEVVKRPDGDVMNRAVNATTTPAKVSTKILS